MTPERINVAELCRRHPELQLPERLPDLRYALENNLPTGEVLLSKRLVKDDWGKLQILFSIDPISPNNHTR